ncbi:MFS transporter [Kiloniella laminariae]|uniref:MFS transporter n=1 Tax=Kiloniella laminariae TaxID=454162 RepID=A0ABT4LP61_9PROT|nr:MFS transporter [Kiloniella laminariae]MCZ4282904.1 MFS transporter [Kiloniella laminariae]
MFSTLSSLVSLFLATAILVMGNGLFSTLIGVRASAEGFANETTGWVMAAYFFGIMSGVFLCRKMVASVGHIRTYAALAALMSILPLLHAYFVDPFAWALFRCLAGIAISGLFMVTESWINERADNAIRGQILAFYMITYYGGLAAGQFLLNLAAPTEVSLFVLISALFSLAIVPVALTRSEQPAPLPKKLSFGLKDLYRLSPLGTVGAAAAGMTNASFYSMGPIFAAEIGLGTDDIALFMGVAIIGGLVLQWPFGRMSDHFDRRYMIMGVASGIFLGCIGVIFGSGLGGILVFVSVAIYGGAAFALNPITVAHANDFLEKDQRVNAAGGLMIVYGIGAMSGPVIASFMMGRVGSSGLFLTTAAVQVILILFALYRTFVRQTIVRALRVPLVLFSPASSTVITDMVQEEQEKLRENRPQDSPEGTR